MADWQMQAAIMILVGYQVGVFGTVTSAGSNDNQPLIIIAFLFYTPPALLTVLIKLGDLAADKIVSICNIVMLLLAGLFFVIGVAVWGGKYEDNSNPGNNLAYYILAYPIMFDIVSAALAIIGAVFLIVGMLGGGGGGTGGGRTAPANA